MHERRRPQRRLAGIAEINICRKIRAELLGIAERNLIEQIVRMLPIMERVPVPGLAGLKEKRITAAAFREQIEAYHPAKTKLRVLAERVGIHGHEPVRRI